MSDTYPGGVVWNTGYDQYGRVVYEAEPATTDTILSRNHAKVERTTFDANGNVTQVQIPDMGLWDAGRVTNQTFDNADRLATRTDPTGTITKYEYDASSNVSRTCVGTNATNPCDASAQITELATPSGRSLRPRR